MGGCFGVPKWKRQLVVEHKFDYIRIEDFAQNDNTYKRLKYGFLYLLSFKAILIFLADIASLVAQFNLIRLPGTEAQKVDSPIRFVTPWIYVSCLVASLSLFVIDARQARRIIRSHDISFTFTNTLAYRFYVYRSYVYFLFFEQINNLKRFKDNMALFVFFRLRGWKRYSLLMRRKLALTS